jgi:hypothetical protein
VAGFLGLFPGALPAFFVHYSICRSQGQGSARDGVEFTCAHSWYPLSE